MTTVFILGINSFIAKNLYFKLKRNNNNNSINVRCLSHSEIDSLLCANNNDIIINFCGVNRGANEDEYRDGNYFFVVNLIKILNSAGKYPHIIHISSLMINGFEGKTIDELSVHHKYFITSKLEGEKYILDNYPKEKWCILRPSNIYGYNCEPYYNNLLVTLMYEKLTKNYKTTKINKNCKRNFLSVNGLCDQIINVMAERKCGTYNIISDNTVSIDSLLKILYDVIPKEISIVNGEDSIMNLGDNCVIVRENLNDLIFTMEKNMQYLHRLKELISIKSLDKLSQPRGDMIEISNLDSKRMYMITIKQGACRGNHYHNMQIEHFYVNNGKVMFILSHKDDPQSVFITIVNPRTLVIINPSIIHTLTNDFIGDNSEIFVASTQEYIPNQSPDTIYVNLFP